MVQLLLHIVVTQDVICVIVTKKPSTPDEEISLETIKKLPPMYF